MGIENDTQHTKETHTTQLSKPHLKNTGIENDTQL